MIIPFLTLLLISSFSYGMDPESLTPSSSSLNVAHNDNEPVGGWITISKDLFNGGLPKGTKIAPLEILQLPLMSSPTLIYDTYVEGFHHLQQQGNKVSPDHKYLILLVGKQLELLTPEGILIPRPQFKSGMSLPIAIRCIKLLGLRKTKQEGEIILNMVKTGKSDQEIFNRFSHNSIVLSQNMNHPHKKYIWNLYIVLRSLHKTNNSSITIKPSQKNNLSTLLFKLASNQITQKEEITAICDKIPTCATVTCPTIEKLLKDYTTTVKKGVNGINYCVYYPTTTLGKLIKSMLADTKKPQRHKIAHTILLNYNAQKLVHLLMPAPTTNTSLDSLTSTQ